MMQRNKKQFLKRKFGRCFYCGSEKKLTIDHIIPKSKGGTGRWKNLQVLCRKCNQAKGNSYPQQNVAVNFPRDIIGSAAINNNSKNIIHMNPENEQPVVPAEEVNAEVPAEANQAEPVTEGAAVAPAEEAPVEEVPAEEEVPAGEEATA